MPLQGPPVGRPHQEHPGTCCRLSGSPHFTDKARVAARGHLLKITRQQRERRIGTQQADPWLSLLSFWAQPVHLCGSHLRSSLLPVPRAGSVDTPRTQGSSGKGTDPSQVQGLPMAMAGSTQTPSKPMITVCQRVSDSCPWAGEVCLATFSVCFLLTNENSSRAFYN